MTPETLALLGVALGALLAGGGNLLLEWRRETLQGRAGVHLIRVILEDAKAEVGRLIKAVEKADSDNTAKAPRWGRPGSLPNSRAWDPYRGAVSGRLPLATLRKVDKAMVRLDSLNSAAARAHKLADDLELRIWDAALQDNDQAVDALTKATSPEELTPAARSALPPAATDFQKAIEAIGKFAPIRPLGQRRKLRDVLPWTRWHWRPIALGVAAAVAVAIALSVSPKSETTEVQDVLAAELDSEALTACERVKDHADRFRCIVVENPDGTACVADARTPKLTASQEPVALNSDASCALTRAIEYSAARQHDGDCTAFTVTAEAEVPSAGEQKKEGFVARLRARLNKGLPSRAAIPPVIVPDSAFVAGC